MGKNQNPPLWVMKFYHNMRQSDNFDEKRGSITTGSTTGGSLKNDKVNPSVLLAVFRSVVGYQRPGRTVTFVTQFGGIEPNA